MSKTILMTGATDGIGLEAAKFLASEGHKVLLHGRSAGKLEAALAAVGGDSQSYQADLSSLQETQAMAQAIKADHASLDVLINNAGIFKTPVTKTADGLDIRFVVNTLAPYQLARDLLPIIPKAGRIVNLSSAAQAPVDLAAMASGAPLEDFDAYAQSKLAITQWTYALAAELTDGPLLVSVNPGSLLATKMVREGFGMAGKDINIGRDILVRAALSADFEGRSGQYFDNDAGAFGPPHPNAQDLAKSQAVTKAVEDLIAKVMG